MRKRLLTNRAENRVGCRRLRCPQPFRGEGLGGLGWGVGGEGRRTSGRRLRAPAMSSAPTRRRPHSPRGAEAFAATSPKRSRAAPGSEAPGGGPSPPEQGRQGRPGFVPCGWYLDAVWRFLNAVRHPGRKRPAPPQHRNLQSPGSPEAGGLWRAGEAGGSPTLSGAPRLSHLAASSLMRTPRPALRAWRSPDRNLAAALER